MKKSISFLSLLFMLVSLMTITSCSKTSDSSKEQKEDYMNESIQNTFFDTSFGASKEEVIRNFQKHGLALNVSISNDIF